MQLPKQLEDWAKNAKGWFRDAGAAPGADLEFSRLYAALHGYGLGPRVVSVFRDPDKQKEMQKRWDRGDRRGLRARPASSSAHTKTGFLGVPRATAIDMPCADDNAAARIAQALGIGTGLSFKEKDPGHFFSLRYN